LSTFCHPHAESPPSTPHHTTGTTPDEHVRLRAAVDFLLLWDFLLDSGTGGATEALLMEPLIQVRRNAQLDPTTPGLDDYFIHDS